MWEDKTEVLQSSLPRLNSGENISKLVDVICFSWIFDVIALVFFHKASFISLCASQWLKSQWIDMPYFSSLFKFHLWVFCIYHFKIYKWHSLFIHVKRYYTFLKLKSELWSQLNFNEFETSLYIRTLYWSMLHLFAVFLVHMITDQSIIPLLIFFCILITHLLDIVLIV